MFPAAGGLHLNGPWVERPRVNSNLEVRSSDAKDTPREDGVHLRGLHIIDARPSYGRGYNFVSVNVAERDLRHVADQRLSLGNDIGRLAYLGGVVHPRMTDHLKRSHSAARVIRHLVSLGTGSGIDDHLIALGEWQLAQFESLVLIVLIKEEETLPDELLIVRNVHVLIFVSLKRHHAELERRVPQILKPGVALHSPILSGSVFTIFSWVRESEALHLLGERCAVMPPVETGARRSVAKHPLIGVKLDTEHLQVTRFDHGPVDKALVLRSLSAATPAAVVGSEFARRVDERRVESEETAVELSHPTPTRIASEHETHEVIVAEDDSCRVGRLRLGEIRLSARQIDVAAAPEIGPPIGGAETRVGRFAGCGWGVGVGREAHVDIKLFGVALIIPRCEISVDIFTF